MQHKTPPLFNVGDKVAKTTGYHYAGTVVAVYPKTTGETRYDVEFVGIGMLHIFGASLFLLTDEQFRDCDDAMRMFTTTLNRARQRNDSKA